MKMLVYQNGILFRLVMIPNDIVLKKSTKICVDLLIQRLS